MLFLAIMSIFRKWIIFSFQNSSDFCFPFSRENEFLLNSEEELDFVTEKIWIFYNHFPEKNARIFIKVIFLRISHNLPSQFHFNWWKISQAKNWKKWFSAKKIFFLMGKIVKFLNWLVQQLFQYFLRENRFSGNQCSSLSENKSHFLTAASVNIADWNKNSSFEWKIRFFRIFIYFQSRFRKCQRSFPRFRKKKLIKYLLIVWFLKGFNKISVDWKYLNMCV